MEEQHNNPSIVIKSSIWYTISGFVAKSMAVVTTPLYARLLSTEDYGNFHVYANWQILFAIIGGMEVASTFNRARFDFKKKEEFDSYVTSCLLLTSISTAVLFLLFSIFPTAFEYVVGMDRRYVNYMFIYLMFLPALDIFQTKQMITYHYKLSSIISFGSAVICSGLAFGLAYLMDGNRLFGRIIGQYMPIAVIGFVMYFVLLKSSHKIKVTYWKYALTLSIPIVFSSLAGQILVSSDKVVVQQLCTAEDVAYIGLATTVSHLMTMFVGYLNGAWSPYFYNKLNAEDYDSIKRGYRFFFGVILFAALGGILIGPEIVAVLGGSKYGDALYLIPPSLLLGVVISVLNQYGAYEVFLKRPRYIAVFTAVAATINVGLDILGVKLFGYMSVTYMTFISYIILILLHMLFTRKLHPEKVLQPKLVLGVIGIAVLYLFIPVALYSRRVVRFAVIGVVVIAVIVTLIVMRKKVAALVKTWMDSKKNKESDKNPDTKSNEEN